MKYNQAELARTLFEEAGDALFLFDPETQQLLNVNPMAERLSGFTREELLRLKATYLFRSEQQGGARQLEQASKESGVFHSRDGFLLRHHDENRWVPVNLTVARLHLKPKTLTLITARDVREQREAFNELQRMQERLRTVIGNTPVILFAIDQDGVFTLSEGKGLEPLGVAAGSVVGKSVFQVYGDHPQVLGHVRRALAGEAFTDLVEVNTPAGAIIFQTHYAPVKDREQRVTSVIGIATDVTAWHKVEQEIRRRNRELAALNRIGQALSRLAEPSEILQLIYQTIGEVLGNRNLYIALHDEARAEITFPVYWIDGQEERRPSRPFGKGITEHVIRTRRAFLVRERLPEVLREHGIEQLGRPGKSLLAVPLLVGEKVLGVLAVQDYYHEHVYSPEHAELLSTFAAQAAVALENARLYSAVQQELQDRRKAEEALRHSEERFRALVEKSTDGISLIAADGTHLYSAASVANILGVSPEEHLGTNAFDRVHPDDLARSRTLFAHLLAHPGESITAEVRCRHADGSWRDLECVGVNRLNEPAVQAIVANFRDITERKRAEEAVRQSETLFRLVWSNSADGMRLTDATGRVLLVNEAFCRLVNLPRSDLERQPLSVAYDTERQAHILQRHCERFVARTVQPRFETEVTLWNGQRVWLEVGNSFLDLDGRPTLLLSIFRDITARKRAERELRESQERFEIVSRATNDAVWDWNLLTDSHRWNEGFQTLFGYSPGNVQPGVDSWYLRIHADDKERVVAGIHAAIHEEGKYWSDEYRFRRADGSYAFVYDRGYVLYDEQNQPVRMIGSMMDISERKQAEETLARERALLRSLIDSVPDLIFYKNREGVYLGCNAAFEHFAGRKEKELVGLTDFDLFPRGTAESFRAKDRDMLAGGKARRNEEWLDYPDGRRVLVEVLETPFRDASGAVLGLIGISRDITERRRLEEQLQQAQKMEAIGQLAGGVAHDFNNLLTAILGNASLVLSSLSRDDAHHAMITAIEKAACRAANLTNQLLGFSRKTLLRPQPLQLNDTIDEVVAILARTIDPRIVLEVRADPELWSVHADSTQMNQVLMNLCLNARDAMADGGRLSIDAHNVVLHEPDVRLRVEARPGEFVRLRVSDSGAGIPPEALPHIFEPFFTTKGPDKGTGLGLAMVYGIVKQHGGWAECRSEVGRGTVFDVFLPRSDASTSNLPPGGARSQALGGRETILIVDDEEMIRNLGRLILQGHGYKVLVAEDGLQALDLYRQRPAEIDLVLLDLTMPRLSGRDTLRQMVELNPEVRVLLTSGYSTNPAIEPGCDNVLGFIGKPYRVDDLITLVRQSLDAALVDGRNREGALAGEKNPLSAGRGSEAAESPTVAQSRSALR